MTNELAIDRPQRPRWLYVCIYVPAVLCGLAVTHITTASSAGSEAVSSISVDGASEADATTPEDPVVEQMRQFLSTRGSSIAAVAGVLQTTMGLPAIHDIQDSGGCHGKMGSAEHHGHGDLEPHGVSQATLDSILADLLQEGPTELAGSLAALTAEGGGVRLDDRARLDGGTIALAVGDELFVSGDWVRAAIQDSAAVHANLAHEIAGHMSYNTPLSCVLLETAFASAGVPWEFDQYRAAFLKYVYPETEIYAELHELAYFSDSAIGDDPYVDIIVQVRNIEAAFPPEVAELIFEWLRLKCSIDPTLSTDARFYCDAAVKPAS